MGLWRQQQGKNLIIPHEVVHQRCKYSKIKLLLDMIIIKKSAY